MIQRISISGDVGSGKSSIIKKFVEKFGYETADVGQLFRARAVAKGLTVAEYDQLVEKNPQEDIDMENDFKNLVQNSQKNIIVSRRLAFYKLPDITSIRLTVDPTVGAKRVMEANRGNQEKKYLTLDEALIANRVRQKRLSDRLKVIYGVDFTDISNYKYIIDTNGKTVDEVLDEIVRTINL